MMVNFFDVIYTQIIPKIDITVTDLESVSNIGQKMLKTRATNRKYIFCLN